MPYSVKFTAQILDELYNNNVLFKYNSPAPKDGKYGWIREDTELMIPSPITLEQNSALYGGPYRGLVGAGRASGLNSIGSFSYTYSPLPHRVTIGRYCSISTGLRVLDSTHPIDTITSSAITFRPNNNLFKDHLTPELREHARNFRVNPEALPTIEHDVWIGANVTLAPQVLIGTGAIVAAGSLVTKDIKPYTIVGGNPAKPIRRRFSDEICQALLETEWWNYDPLQVFQQDLTDVDKLIGRIRDEQLDRYEPWTITLGHRE